MLKRPFRIDEQYDDLGEANGADGVAADSFSASSVMRARLRSPAVSNSRTLTAAPDRSPSRPSPASGRARAR